MTLLKITLVIVLWLVAGTIRLPAQIRELWHRDFTNTYWWPWAEGGDLPTNYFATVIAVDIETPLFFSEYMAKVNILELLA